MLELCKEATESVGRIWFALRVNDTAAGISKSGGVRRVLGLVELSLTEDRDAESLLLYRFLIKNLTFHSLFQSVKHIYFCK